jgi:hypothetical protein
VHFFKQRHFLIFSISCNNSFGCFVEYSLPLFRLVFHILFFISVPLSHFYLFLETVVCYTEFLFKQTKVEFADDDEACKVFCLFLIFVRFLDFISANIKKYPNNINL